MYRDSFLKVYLDDLAAKKPAPGGGSAGALAGALGASLMSMVCNFTVGKEKYKDVQNRIKEILLQSETSRLRLAELVDLDCLAYRSKDLKQALDVPMEVACLSNELANLCPELANIGNINLITDVGCAYYLFEAAFKSARLNVEINLKSLIDKAKKEKIIKELDSLEKDFEILRQRVGDKIGKSIRG
jgi:formiminotetrahydrofolate cyclodeaminase